MRKDADVKEHDEGIAPAIAEEQSLTDALCSRLKTDRKGEQGLQQGIAPIKTKIQVKSSFEKDSGG